jgi:hypothetical protein
MLILLLINIINNISNSRLRIYCLIYTPFSSFVCRPFWGLGLEMYRRFATYIEEGGRFVILPFFPSIPHTRPSGLIMTGWCFWKSGIPREGRP